MSVASEQLTQSFLNSSDRTLFINLELSTARFRLEPGEELLLRYGRDDHQDQHGSPLRVEMIASSDGLELVVWTSEEAMFFPDGRPAPRDYRTS